MVELSKTQLTGIVTLAMLIAGIGAGTLTYNPNSTYYCESRNLVYDCDSLSSTTKTCYITDMANKICTEGWKPIADYISNEELEPEPFSPEFSVEKPKCSDVAYKEVCTICENC